jgi:iron complex outermembrane receptor protein
MKSVIGSTFRGVLKASVALGVLFSATAGVCADGAPGRTAKVAGDGDGGNAVTEVTVVGSRLSQSSEGPTPATVFDREKIDALGVTSISDVLKYLPQQSFTTRYNIGGGAQAVQLRGLAVGSTLVLVNGRRAVPGASAGAARLAFFDLNTIPLAAVERIEILADSASAVYGADAVGGVVNIVLRSRIERPTLDLYYGAADGGAEERRGSISIGGQKGRAEGLVIFDYLKRDALFGRERDIVADADYRRYGGVDRRTLGTLPGNICAVSGNLPGLSTPCAAVPLSGSGVLADFVATAGKQNLGAPYAARSYVTPAENYGVMAAGSVGLDEKTALFGELMYTDRENLAYFETAPQLNAPVPANNPFNPFGAPVLASFQLGELSRTTYHERSYRGVAGMRGSLGRWDWEASATGTQSKSNVISGQDLDTTTALRAALAATTTSTALNVFKAGPLGSPELLASVLSPIRVLNRSNSDVYGVGGFVRGDLFSLPAGPVQLVVGGEWRQEKIHFAGTSATSIPINGERKAYAGYFETKLPILAADGPTLARGLNLTVAGRYDHYSDFGGTFNAQYGAEWRPHRDLLIRASYGESYRAPDLYSLYSATTTTSNALAVDPRRNNEQARITNISGGNPKLTPETSQSASFGGVWTPDLTWRPRLGVSFWHIKQDNRIVTGFSSAVLLANEGQVPAGRIVRGAATPADLAAGMPGALVSLDARALNVGQLETRGVDLEASAAILTGWGEVSPRLTATRVDKYASQDFPTSAVLSRVGIANTSGSVPRWKAVGSLSWDTARLSLTASARYTASYDDAGTTNLANGLTVKSTTLVDLQALARMDAILPGSRIAEGLKIRAGVSNLFDVAPPYASITAQGFDGSQGDIRQRFIYVAASKSF